MNLPEEVYRPKTLIEILQRTDETANSAFFVNPPQKTTKDSLLFLGATSKLYLKGDNRDEFFREIDRLRKSGYHLVITIDYEAGYLFSHKFSDIASGFGDKILGEALVFDTPPIKIKLVGMPFGVSFEGKKLTNNFRPDCNLTRYISDIGKVKERIREGDTYQINYTMLCDFKYLATPPEIFAGLIFNQTTLYSAYINKGNEKILSFSPELFFSSDGRFVDVRPMKGTMKTSLVPFQRESFLKMREKRSVGYNGKSSKEKHPVAYHEHSSGEKRPVAHNGKSSGEKRSVAYNGQSSGEKRGTHTNQNLSGEKELRLNEDPKQRAENLMIADLMRNDLHRLTGGRALRVLSLFEEEKYETLLQMVSGFRGEIDKSTGLAEIFGALYPCGSITGAPKISSMRIIRDLEKRPRGLYTGIVGFVSGKKSVFNIAIRTLQLDDKKKTGVVGLGSGIVWDSDAKKEYEECLLKGEFFTREVQHFRIIETILYQNGEAPFLQHHIGRMKRSAKRLFFYFDEGLFLRKFSELTQKLNPGQSYRLRFLLGKYGDFQAEVHEPAPLPSRIVVAFSKKVTDSNNPFLYYKTTNRVIYNAGRETATQEGLFDLLYQNEFGEVTEGGITNIFIFTSGKWLTPHHSCGLLQGVGRKVFMQTHKVREVVLRVEDILNAEKVVLTNAIRGAVAVDEIKGISIFSEK
ncbi:MAG: chorismate-binding protein [Ignavibacteriales bacterium]|nr:MAG: hypothetical protein F9K26_10635 [Ignavibacteriaceae bacterium]MBW7874100.1 chorismate-binding protein [Ignavibacteria bacterium]MCZ2143200.1 chorismate-binding protein [Ignavibacteriales bacterium]OQY70688.1 MAG: hypothetical protein B6D45_10820 [Ignavibacteriales bacterium UTCHB3]MBV6444080.1 Isochorismate synthase MenF [Ignavibacteriaceae bacterium]